jgi:hypothetical protein
MVDPSFQITDIAEITSVPLSRGGTSRYIIAQFYLSEPTCTISQHVRDVDNLSKVGAACAKSRTL